MSSSLKSDVLLSAVFILCLACPASAANVVPDNPTFPEDILPIFQRSCQSCHRPGQMAPFSLLTYDDARPWVRSIKSNVEARYMPPWHLDRTVGEYDPDPSLTDAEIATIAKWVDSGALRGDMKNAPAPIDWPENTWRFGEQPDVIIKSPRIDVPAHSAELYPDPEVPSGLAEDRYIKWIQVLPGDAKITHHVMVFSITGAAANGSVTGGGTQDLDAIAALFGVDLPTDPVALNAFREQAAQFARGGVPTLL